MEGHEWTGQSDPQDTDSIKQNRWSEHCKTFLIRDAHGAIKELVFPRALDLDRPKRERTIFSSRQLGCLEEEFKQNQYLVGKERSAVAKRLGLSETQVKVWFQNRRTKHKKDNERCGEGQDFQAESKAARNVLKLLEYKTALNYSTLLNQAPTHLDTYRSVSSSSVDYLVCQSPNTVNDHKGKMSEAKLKPQEIVLHNSPGHIKGAGFESVHNKDIETPQLQFTIASVLSNRDVTTNDIPIDMAPNSSSVGSSSESLQNSNDAILHHDVDDYPEAELQRVETSEGLVCANFKTANLGKNKRLQTDDPYCVDKISKHCSLHADHIAREDLTHEVLAKSDEYILHANEKLHEDILTCVQSKKQGNTDLSRAYTRYHPYPGFTHGTVDTSQETWQKEDHMYNVNNSPCRLPPVYSEGCLLENSSCRDNKSIHNGTSSIAASRGNHGGVFTNSNSNRSIGQYLSNLINCPSNIHNTYLSYQPSIVTPGQVYHHSQQLPFTNMKHCNYYVPSVYGTGFNETSPCLQILHHAPVSNAYGDGRQQRSFSTYAMSTPQTSFLSQPGVNALSSQHHGYHMRTPFG